MNGKLIPAIVAIVISGILVSVFTLIVHQVRVNTQDLRSLNHRVDVIEHDLR